MPPVGLTRGGGSAAAAAAAKTHKLCSCSNHQCKAPHSSGCSCGAMAQLLLQLQECQLHAPGQCDGGLCRRAAAAIA
jgi:hypothetical protein